MALSAEVARLTKPNDLIVVRSPLPAFETEWQQPQNYHDPRVFYLSHRRGWTIGLEQADVSLIADPVRRGARLFADPQPTRPAALDQWLAANARRVSLPPETVGGIWILD
jgi:hypothetical protein